MSWRFGPDEEPSAAFRRVALEELDKVRTRLTATGADPELAIHQARRSFKKLRALVRLARPSLRASFRTENLRWRDAGRLLSAARDATVLVQTFDRVVRECGHDLPPDSVAALRERVADGQGASGDGLGAPAPVGEVLGLIDRAEAEMDGLRWPQTRKEIFRALRDSQYRLRRTWKAAEKDGSSESLHDWRKRVKDFSAQVSLFRARLPDEIKSHRDAAKEVAETLGQEHDLFILAEKLRAAGSEPERAQTDLLRRIHERREELRRRALAEGRGLSSVRGKPFARSVLADWDRFAAHRREGPAPEQSSGSLLKGDVRR